MRGFLLVFIFITNLYPIVFGDYISFANYMGYEIDYNKAIKKAKDQKKDLFIFIIKDGCKFCHKMMDEVLSDSGVDNYISKNYVKLILHRTRSKYIPAYLLKRRFTPISFIVDYKTIKIKQMIVGYMETDQYLWQFKGD